MVPIASLAWVFLSIPRPQTGLTLPMQIVKTRGDKLCCVPLQYCPGQGAQIARPSYVRVAPVWWEAADGAFSSRHSPGYRQTWRQLWSPLHEWADGPGRNSVRPFFQPKFPSFHVSLQHSGCSSLFSLSLLFQVRQMKKPLLRSADGEDSTPCPSSPPTLACWSHTSLPVPPDMPIITIAMRWKSKKKAGLQAAWRTPFIYQVCKIMLMRNAQKRIHQLAQRGKTKARPGGVAVWLNAGTQWIINGRLSAFVCISYAHPRSLDSQMLWDPQGLTQGSRINFVLLCCWSAHALCS